MFQGLFKKVTYVSYFTVEPSPDQVEEYLTDVSNNILSLRDEKLVIVGRNAQGLNLKNKNIEAYEDLVSLIDGL